MVKRIMFLGCLFLTVPLIQTMNYSSFIDGTPAEKAGTLISSVSLGLLIASPENEFHENCLNSLGLLSGVSLRCKEHINNVSAFLLGASFWAARTKDKNRSIPDHVRALAAGGLISGGLWEFLKNMYQCNGRGSITGLGALAAGVLLLSQKDIKTVLGWQEGISLNPPSGVKKIVRNNCGHNLSIEIKRAILEVAQQGQNQAVPFCYRIVDFLMGIFKKDDVGLKEETVWISPIALVEDVLPYLRVKDDERLKENVVTVFSVDKDVSRWLDRKSIIPYLTLEAYKRAFEGKR